MDHSSAPADTHWTNIRRRQWLIYLVAAGSAALAYFLSTLIEPMYESKTTFFLASNASAPSFVRTDLRTPEPLFPTADEKTAALNVGILRGREMFSALSKATGQSIDDLQKRVDITVSGEFMVDVFARDPSPEAAARAANLVPELYRSFHETILRDNAATEAAVLQSQADSVTEQIADLRAESAAVTAEFGGQLGAVTLARLAEQREAAQAALRAVQLDIKQSRARLSGIQASLGKERIAYSNRETALSTAILDLMVEQLLALRVDLASVTDGPQSPRRRAIEQQMSEIETAIAAEEDRLATATAKPTGSLHEQLRAQAALLESDIGGLEARLPALQADVARTAKAHADALAAADAEAERTATRQQLEGRLEVLRSNLAEAQLQAQNAKVPLVVVENAFPTMRPNYPLPILNAVVAGITGLILGIYAALFLGHRDRLRVARQVQGVQLPAFSDAEFVELRALLQERKKTGGAT